MAELPTRSLGGLKSSAMGLGCMSLSPGIYGENVDEKETEKTLRRALDLGVTLLNTADFYTSMKTGEASQNIKLIGKVLKDYPRERVVLSMKWGPWVEAGWKPFDTSPEACRKRVDDALAKLGTNYIDFLVYRNIAGHADIHNTSKTDVAKGMKAVLDAGKVKAIGVSECTVEDMKEIQRVVPISVVELEWSLFSREQEADVIPLARNLGAGIQAYSPISRGLISGRFDKGSLEEGPQTDFRNRNSRFTEDALEQNQKLAKRVVDFAKKKGCTPSQLAIAWVLAQGDDVVPIPGTKRIPYLEENLGALNVKLSRDEAEELAALVPASEIAGKRID